MTSNQLTFVRNAEIARNNRMLEELKAREIDESKRHSLATERENFRHNFRNEQIDQSKVWETARSNRANENINASNASTNRFNAFTNYTNARSNAANARTNQLNALTNMLNIRVASRNASTNATNALTNRQSIQETARHNRAVELETARYQKEMNAINAQSNVIRERTNQINYELGIKNIGIASEQNAIHKEANDIKKAELIINGVTNAAKAVVPLMK